jgi:hypothetical protein
MGFAAQCAIRIRGDALHSSSYGAREGTQPLTIVLTCVLKLLVSILLQGFPPTLPLSTLIVVTLSDNVTLPPSVFNTCARDHTWQQQHND